jgi:hypothetical protein
VRAGEPVRPGLPEADARLRAGLVRHQRGLLAAGVLLVSVGLAYDGWALLRFDPRADAEAHAGFDRPVSSLTALYQPYRPFLRAARPRTELEVFCMGGLRRQMAFSVGMSMTLIRVLLGTLVVVLGLAVIAIVGERRRLLALIDRVLAEPSPDSAAPRAAPPSASD